MRGYIKTCKTCVAGLRTACNRLQQCRYKGGVGAANAAPRVRTSSYITRDTSTRHARAPTEDRQTEDWVQGHRRLCDKVGARAHEATWEASSLLGAYSGLT